MHVVCTHPLGQALGRGRCTLRTLSLPRSLPSSSAPLGPVEAPRGWFRLHRLLGDGKLFSIPVSLHAVCL